MGMIERDPITEWKDAILVRFQTLGWVMVLLAFLLCLVAPLFGPAIKHMKRKQYVLFSDYEARAEADMKFIRPMLWMIAFVGWCVFFYCQR